MPHKVVFSLLGTTVDQGFSHTRWEKWRPSVALCQHKDLLISEYHLLYSEKFKKLSQIVVADIHHVSPETKVIEHIIEFKNPWDFEEVYEKLLLLLKQMVFDPENAEYYFHITTGSHVAQICIFLLTESRLFPGKLLQTSPLKDDIYGTYTIIDLDLSKYDKIASRFKEESINDISFLKSGIDTKNKKFNQLIEKIEQVSLRSKEPILLTGPTGAGKSKLASRIYQLKKSKGMISGEFIEINCATLRGDSAMSTLFGHKKGSFTGALQDRAGLLKTADRGIVFLDEIGDLGIDEQTMLLRAIEEKKFMPLGSDKDVESNFQLLCGTNKNLMQAVSSGKFRDDLLSRINLWKFELPGLKDRVEDIEPNIAFELNQYAEKYGTHIAFNKEAKEYFLKFAKSKNALWKANFRDLNGAIMRMCTLALGGRITLALVNEEMQRLTENWEDTTPMDNLLGTIFSPEELNQIDLFDYPQLAEVIAVCQQSKTLSEAGRKLFSVSRLEKNKTNDADRLRKYLLNFGLTFEKVQK